MLFSETALAPRLLLRCRLLQLPDSVIPPLKSHLQPSSFVYSKFYSSSCSSCIWCQNYRILRDEILDFWGNLGFTVCLHGSHGLSARRARRTKSRAQNWAEELPARSRPLTCSNSYNFWSLWKYTFECSLVQANLDEKFEMNLQAYFPFSDSLSTFISDLSQSQCISLSNEIQMMKAQFIDLGNNPTFFY